MPLIIPGNSQTSTGYTIDQSIRFDDAAEHFMYSPTPSSSKDFTTTATISLWFKLGDLKAGYLAGAFYGNNNRYNILAINSSGQLLEYDRVGGASTSNGTGTIGWTTTRVFRDPSAWYHAVFVWDTTNAVQDERFRLYINGVRETDFATEQALGASELVYWFGKSTPTTLGAYFTGTGYADTYYFDGYMAEMHGVDGTALNQDSFGEFNSSGIWIPKEYSGSHGTDGFYIKGADASALGTNSAANGNNFTLNGISSHDKMLDSPTNNFCVMNAIENVPCNFSEGNLTLDSTANFSGNAIRGTVHIKGGSTGKWYYEVVGSLTGDYWGTGWMLSSIINPSGTVIGQESGSVGFYNTGSYQNTTNVQGVITKPAAGDVIGVGLDASTGQVFLRDDTGYYVGTLSSNVLSNGVVITGFSGEDLVMASRNSSSGTCTYNFGQDGTFAGAKTAQGNTDANGIGNFFYTVPDGFLAICTKNLGS